MKHIAILTCLDACKVCTGASCLQAWNRRNGGFVLYVGEEVSLDAFFHCNGCGTAPESDPGMWEKIGRLQAIGVTAVHIGICAVKDRETMDLCPTIEKIVELLSEKGISFVLGTH